MSLNVRSRASCADGVPKAGRTPELRSPGGASRSIGEHSVQSKEVDLES